MLGAGVRPEVLLATGYGVLLLACAAGLEWLARHAAARSERYRTGGFTYHPGHDLWVCPQNEQLWPVSTDHRLRLVRYRARATVCNACPSKRSCTGSDEGREVVRAIDPWPHSEAGRFHRGISVLLTVIAATFLGVATGAYHRPAELAVEGPAVLLTVALLWLWVRDFLRTPTGFPDVAVVRGRERNSDDDTAASSAGPALSFVDLAVPASRRSGTAWGSQSAVRGRRYARRLPGAAQAATRPGDLTEEWTEK